jgi:hypothetical protein
MRGLSGAVTSLILVIASVIIALIVVGFAFNLFGNYASQGSNTVTPVGSAYLYVHELPNGTASPDVYLVFTVNNKGPNVNITSVAINGVVYPVNKTDIYKSNSKYQTLSGNYIPTGSWTLMLNFTGVNNLPNVVSGSTVPIEIRLSSSQAIELTAYVFNSLPTS